MLRTSSELIRYAVEATDGKIGAVQDLLFDDATWRVRSIVVDTGGFLWHHKVLIDPKNVTDLKFPEETLVLRLSKNEVNASPDAKAAPPVSQQQSGHQLQADHVHDRHLRSSNEICTYTLDAKDDRLGVVHGLMIETSTWTIRYLIVDTGEWLSGRFVLLGPQAVEGIDWSSSAVKASVTSDAIRHAPPYDETAELSRDYEAFLHDYYGWPPYWL